MKQRKQVGWFRPIYYFAPPVVTLVCVLVAAYRVLSNPSEFNLGLCAILGLTMVIQAVTAIREYRTWMFNFELLSVNVAYAKCLQDLQKNYESEGDSLPFGAGVPVQISEGADK